MSRSADVLASPVSMEPTPYAAGPSPPFGSPRTPQNTPPNSANRRLVRPLLQQRKNTIQQQKSYSVSANDTTTTTTSVTVVMADIPSPRYSQSTTEDPSDEPMRAVASPTSSDRDAADATPASAKEKSNGEDVVARYPAVEAAVDGEGEDARVDLPSIPMIHCPPLRSSAQGSNILRATQPHIRRIHSSRPGPLTLPRADTPMSLASYPSNLSTDMRANSSVSSSFAGLSSASKQGAATPATTAANSTTNHHPNTNNNNASNTVNENNGMAADGVGGPKLTSPPMVLSGRSGSTGFRGPTPPLLRSSLSGHNLSNGELATPSSTAASTLHRMNLSGLTNCLSPRLRVGATPPAHAQPPLSQSPALFPPSSATSVVSGAATPLSSSNRSSARPSFLRMVAPTSTLSPMEAGSPGNGAVPSRNGETTTTPLHPLSNGHSTSARVVNGRVPMSPAGSRRPELSARRTTFNRTGSAASLHSNAPSVSGAEDDRAAAEKRDSCSAATAERAAATGAVPASTLNGEMRSFVLGQYRTLQREVLALPTATPATAAADKTTSCEQTDITAADFQHVKKISCPRHSKAAKRAEQKRLEEERLRALQQQHHDMAIIRNGGREEVGVNMKSSTMLAGSLQRLRSRHKPSAAHRSVDRGRSSLDQTISSAFDMEVSPFGSPEEEVNGTVPLYGGEGPFAPSASDKPLQPFSLSGGAASAPTAAAPGMAAEHTNAVTSSGAVEAEAWHSSKFFMAAGTTANGPAAQTGHDRRSGRTVNKNGMKGEAIVVALMPDSDDESEASADERWESSLKRTKGGKGNGRSASVDTAWRTAPTAVSTSVIPTDVAAAKRAGERLAAQDRPRTAQAAALTPTKKSSSLFRKGGGHDDDNSDSSSSDDDACFSFNKLRSQRLRSNNLSLSSSQPLDNRNLSTTQPPVQPPPSAQSPDRVQHHSHHVKKTVLSPSKASSSLDANVKDKGEEDDEEEGDDDDDACCFCCPCKRPENFLALCRASSHSGSFTVTEPAKSSREAPAASKTSLAADGEVEEKAPRVADSTIPFVEDTTPVAQRSKKAEAAGRAGEGSPVVFEDLEGGNDEDEPLLSMQSFRRTSIQRVR